MTIHGLSEKPRQNCKLFEALCSEKKKSVNPGSKHPISTSVGLFKQGTSHQSVGRSPDNTGCRHKFNCFVFWLYFLGLRETWDTGSGALKDEYVKVSFDLCLKGELKRTIHPCEFLTKQAIYSGCHSANVDGQAAWHISGICHVVMMYENLG